MLTVCGTTFSVSHCYVGGSDGLSQNEDGEHLPGSNGNGTFHLYLRRLLNVIVPVFVCKVFDKIAE